MQKYTEWQFMSFFRHQRPHKPCTNNLHIGMIIFPHIDKGKTHLTSKKETQQGKSEGFESCDWPSNLTQIGFKSSIIWPVIWWMTSMLHQAFCTISNPFVSSNWSYNLETINLGENQLFFVACDLEIRKMTMKNKRAHLLWYFNRSASLHSHQWIQTWVTVWKHPIWVKIGNFLFRGTLKFDWWL